MWNNRPLRAALELVVALQVLVVSAPFAQGLFETTNLSLAQWALAAGVGATVLVLDEVGKQVARGWNRSRKPSSGSSTRKPCAPDR